MKSGKDTSPEKRPAVQGVSAPAPLDQQTYGPHCHGGITHVHFHQAGVPHEH